MVELAQLAEPESSPEERAQVLIARAAAAELRLIRQERKAERRLAETHAALRRDQARLKRAEERVQRRLAEVAVAERELNDRQAERASGPLLDRD